MAFPPCLAASAVMAVSTMPATAATGGVLVRTIAATPTTGVCTTTTRTPTTTATLRATCSVFVACRTKHVVPEAMGVKKELTP